ncbi:calmodulin-like protein 3 [Fagus crenata]
MFDRNRDGKITKKELSDSLQDKDMMQMIEKIDVNGDGFVDIDEFGVLYQTIMEEKDEEDDVKEAFNVFDQNGDGFIRIDLVIMYLDYQQHHSSKKEYFSPQ